MLNKRCLEAYATIVSTFLTHKENRKESMRYVFRGFDSKLTEKMVKILEKEFFTSIPVLTPTAEYRKIIKSRADNKPIIVHIAGGRVSEHSSIYSTFKIIKNEFYPFRKIREKGEGVYDLYDVAEWLFQQNNIDKVVRKFLTAKEYSDKKEWLQAVFTSLKILWKLGITNPSLRNRLAPSSIADLLSVISQSSQINFNDIAKNFAFEPSLSLVSLVEEESIKRFLKDSIKLTYLLKGSDLDRRGKMAKLAQNTIRGVLLYITKYPEVCKKVGIKNPLSLLKSYEEKDGRKRVWNVSSRDVEILEYSLVSGLPQKTRFSIQSLKTGESFILDNTLDGLFKMSNGLLKFLTFLKEINILRQPYIKEPPFEVVTNHEKITLTFRFLESYLFARKNLEAEINEALEIRSNT